MANFATVDKNAPRISALQFEMDDLNPIPKSEKPKHLKKPLKSGDGEKNSYNEFTADVGKALVSIGSKGLKDDDDDEVTKLIKSIEEQNKNAKQQPTATKKPPEKIIIPSEFSVSVSDSDSDKEFFATTGYKSLTEMDGGRKTRKKSKVFRHNLRKNKISGKYIMLKQCGGAKAKKGAKSNPFSSKAKASRSRRKGSCYYKKKGRTLKMSKSSGKKKGTKKRRKSRRRRR